LIFPCALIFAPYAYFAQAIYAADAAMANVTGFLRYGLRQWH